MLVLLIFIVALNLNLIESICVSHDVCRPCTNEERQIEVQCAETGFVQEYICSNSGVMIPEFLPSIEDIENTNKLQKINMKLPEMKPNTHVASCIPDIDLNVNKVFRFEIVMICVAAYTLYYVRKRKRMAYKRLTTIVNA